MKLFDLNENNKDITLNNDEYNDGYNDEYRFCVTFRWTTDNIDGYIKSNCDYTWILMWK